MKLRDIPEYLAAFDAAPELTLQPARALPGGPPAPTVTDEQRAKLTARDDTAVRAGPHPWSLDWNLPITQATPRIALFKAKLAESLREIVDIQNEYQRRSTPSGSRIRFDGVARVREMPEEPGGFCPTNSALAYVYRDLFDRCKAALAYLARYAPPRFAAPDDVLGWAYAVDLAITLQMACTNIRPLFLFPTSSDPRVVGVEETYWRNSDKAPVRTKIRSASEPGGPGYDVFRDGAKDTRYGSYGESRQGLPLALWPTIAGMQQSRTWWWENDCLSGPLCDSPGFPWTPYTGVGDDPAIPVRMLWGEHNGRGELSVGRAPEWARRAIAQAWISDQPHTRESLSGAWVDRKWRDGARRIVHKLWIRRWIEFYDQKALVFSQLNLNDVLAESLGFYVFNHNVWYADRLGLTPEQVREMQAAVQMANLQSNAVYSIATAVGRQVLAAVNPIAGILGEILYALAGPLIWEPLFQAIRDPDDVPRPLFLRVPPFACRPVPAEDLQQQVGADRAAPILDLRAKIPFRHFDPPKSSTTPLILGGAGLAALAYFFSRK